MRSEPAPASAPNVLLIVLDDVNDWVSHLGVHPGARTPHIDALAARGVSFTRAYAPAPSCSPARVSLLTGLHPSTTGVYDNDQEFLPYLASVTTLPGYFRRHGFSTLAVGKVFHRARVEQIEPFWNEYVDFRPHPDEKGHHALNALDGRPWDWGPIDAPASGLRDYRRTSWAIEALGREHQAPFLLAVGLGGAHLPWYVPREYFDRFPLEHVELPETRADDLDDVPDSGRRLVRPIDHDLIAGGGQWRRAVQAYLAALAFVDDQVGRLIGALDAGPRRDDTIVLLCSDHGWHLGEKGQWRKFTLWEESTRIPLVVSVPGLAPAEHRCASPAELTDVFPTLVELTGLPPADVEGLGLRPQLVDPARIRDRPAVMTFWPGNHAVVDSRWRYIRYADGSEELYDHSVDPQEWVNLANRSEEAPVKQRLARFIPARDAPPKPKLDLPD